MTDQKEYWQKFDKAFFDDGYQLANTFLSGGLTKENLFTAQKYLYKTINELTETFIQRTKTEGNPPECKKGCSFCCHQTVLASSYELLYLADFLKKKFPAKLLDGIKYKADKKAVITSKLELDKLLKYKMPCPLLHTQGGFCMAYQARPMACRIYLSKSVKSCEDDLNTPDDDTIFTDLYEMPLRAGRMMNEGFQGWLRKSGTSKLQLFETTIDQGLVAAFTENAFDGWQKGQAIFRNLDENQ